MNYRQIELNGAPSQYDRWLRALDPDYAKVDGRSLKQLQAFAVEFARLIYFYDLRDRIDGNWVGFFVADPDMTCASLETMDVAATEYRFEQLEQRFGQAQGSRQKWKLFGEGIEMIHALAQRMDQWLEGLSRRLDHSAARLLGEALAAEIEAHLRDALQQLRAFDSAAETTLGLDWHSFGPRWQLDPAGTGGALDEGTTPAQRVESCQRQLRPLLFEFVDAILNLQADCRDLWEESFSAGNTKPQIALYQAFTTLFRHAQNTINAFSERYANFYYRDVLREQTRQAVPDSVYLNFLLADDEEVLSSTVASGTLFPAGQDENDNEILYAADKTLVVTAAQIEQILAVRVVHEDDRSKRSRDKCPERPGDLCRHVQDVFATRIDISTDVAEENAEAYAFESAWPTFGCDEVGSSDLAATKHATLGFAIASPYLLLTGGTRDVTVTFSLFHRNGSAATSALEQPAAATGLSSSEVLASVVNESFRFYASTYGGWFEVQHPSVTEADAFKLTIHFRLDELAPPLVAVDAEAPSEEVAAAAAPFLTDDTVVTATDPAPGVPTLKAYLQTNAGDQVALAGPAGTVDVPPRQVLVDWRITNLHISTDVAGLGELQLQNTDGPIITEEPFSVFGGLPTLGSYMLIQSEELFAKTLSNLDICIDWFNLPQNETGLWGYYRNYVIGLDGQRHVLGKLFNNSVFKTTFRIQNPGRWTLWDAFESDTKAMPIGALEYDLFRTNEAQQCVEGLLAGPLCESTRFEHLPVSTSIVPNYYQADDSAIRLELAAPNYAFGNDLYPQNVLNAVIEDLPNVNTCCEECCSECQVLADASAKLEACVDGCLVKSTPQPLMTWQVIGSWNKLVDGAPEFDVARAPDLKRKVRIKDRVVRWRKCTSRRKDGMISLDLRRNFAPKEHSWAMAYAAYVSDEAETINWQLGSDDQAIVWVNGIKIYDYQGERAWDANQAQGSVQLQKGTNYIWFQTGNSTGPWQFSMAVGNTFQDCLEDCLQEVKGQLRTASITCFFCCVAKGLVAPGSLLQTALRDLETRLLEASHASAAEAARVFQDFYAASTDLVGEDAAESIERCWQTAERVWQAADRVGTCAKCVSECGSGDQDCMIKCVQLCVADLTASYEACLKSCIDNCMKPKSELKYPNEPYLPQAVSVTVDYSADCEVPTLNGLAHHDAERFRDDLGADPVSADTACAEFFHLLPFDGYDDVPISSGAASLLPEYPYDGNLYLGFTGLELPQTLTLLFQMEARPDQTCDGPLPPVRWSYLADNHWRTKDLSVLADTTNGLRNTGVVTLGIPRFDSTKNTALSPDYHWLRVTAVWNVGQFPGTAAIYPHVLTATWRQEDATGEHLSGPLPAHTISSSVQELPDIARVNQPMESFGGRPRETNRAFQVRLGERLRHKDRAELGWDYERLVLEQFPTIWKAQTLPTRSLDRARGVEQANTPGSVIVVVVPGPHSQEVLDPTAPTVPLALLSRIEDFLRRQTSPFVQLQVVNPNYVRMTVDAEVQFYDQEDPVLREDQLNDELVAYLSPWFYDAARAAKAGRYTSEADVAEFIQTRPYVESLLKLNLHRGDEGCRDWCFLTSAHSHQICSANSHCAEEVTA